MLQTLFYHSKQHSFFYPNPVSTPLSSTPLWFIPRRESAKVEPVWGRFDYLINQRESAKAEPVWGSLECHTFCLNCCLGTWFDKFTGVEVRLFELLERDHRGAKHNFEGTLRRMGYEVALPYKPHKSPTRKTRMPFHITSVECPATLSLKICA